MVLMCVFQIDALFYVPYWFRLSSIFLKSCWNNILKRSVDVCCTSRTVSLHYMYVFRIFFLEIINFFSFKFIIFFKTLKIFSLSLENILDWKERSLNI